MSLGLGSALPLLAIHDNQIARARTHPQSTDHEAQAHPLDPMHARSHPMIVSDKRRDAIDLHTNSLSHITLP